MKHPSRDLTYEWGRTAPEQLSAEASALDTKIITIFAISCVIISVTSALVGKIHYDVTLIPFAIAFISFIVILAKTIWVTRPQWFFVADSPQILREDYWELEIEEAKDKYWNWLEKDFDANYKIVRSKGRALLWNIPLLAIETTSLVVWLFL